MKPASAYAAPITQKPLEDGCRFETTHRRRPLDILMLAMMALFPLDFLNIKVGGFGWSIGRILLFLVVPMLLFRKLSSPRVFLDRSFVLGLSFLLSMALSLLPNPRLDRELVLFYLPSYAVGVCAFLTVYSYFARSPRALRDFSIVINAWTSLILVFSLFNLYSLYILNEIPFAAFINEHAFMVAQSKRIFLPTNTPPHLSIFVAFSGLWWLGRYLAKPRPLYLLLFAAMVPICFLTFSRSGLISFTLGFLVVLVFARIFGIAHISTRLYICSLCLAAAVVFAPELIRYTERHLGTDSAARLIGFDLSEDKDFYHYYYRLQAILIFAKAELAEKLFGIGVGNYEAVVEDSPYSFSLYLTCLAEQGLFGAIIALAVFFSPLSTLFRRLRRLRLGKSLLAALGIAVVLASANFFYEFRVFVPMWITVGWIHAVASTPDELLRSAFRGIFELNNGE